MLGLETVAKSTLEVASQRWLKIKPQGNLLVVSILIFGDGH